MKIGVDIGGTKTLVGAFNGAGELINSIKFTTNHDYDSYITILTNKINKIREIQDTETTKASSINIAAPALINDGVAQKFGNLPWENKAIAQDISNIISLPALLENDAKVAALFESSKLPGFNRVAYLTISTGIGLGVTVEQKIDSALSQAEVGFMSFVSPDTGLPAPWESFASGKALLKRIGLLGRDITDPDIWTDQAKRLAPGIQHILAFVQPDVLVTGGGAGQFLEQFRDPLLEELSKNKGDLVSVPPIVVAHEPEMAVLLGTYLMS